MAALRRRRRMGVVRQGWSRSWSCRLGDYFRDTSRGARDYKRWNFLWLELCRPGDGSRAVETFLCVGPQY